MRRGWNPELEKLVRRADPVARILPEVVATTAEDVRDRADEWAAADSLEGLFVRYDGGVEAGGENNVLLETGVSSAYLGDLARAEHFDCARIELPTGGFFAPAIVSAWLSPRVDPDEPKTVARWGMQLLWVARHNLAPGEPDPGLRLHALHEPLYVDAAGELNPSAVVFDLAAAGVAIREPVVPPPYLGPNPGQAEPVPATVFVHVWAAAADGSPATNAGWGYDPAGGVHDTGAYRLQRAVLGETAFGWVYADALPGVPRLTLHACTLTPRTASFILSPVDLGTHPPAEVELVAQGETPLGTALDFQVRADDGAWVSFHDGDLVATDNRAGGGSDLSAASAHPVSVRQVYHVRVTLTPSASVSPVARAIGARAVERTLYEGESRWGGARWAFDPVTLKGEITDSSLTLVRTGPRDYRDPGTELLGRYDVADITVRVWLGHPTRLPRSRWMLLDAFLLEDYTSHGPAIELALLSPLGLARVKLPPAQQRSPHEVVREPIEYRNATLADVYQDLVASAIALPERFRGESPTSTATVTKRLADGEGKDELDAIARLAGGTVISSQGRVKWVDVRGARTLAAVFPREEVRPVRVTPGLRQRVPEYFVRYQWLAEAEDSGGRYLSEVRSFHTAALSRLGTATLDAPRELPDVVARWIDTDVLAEAEAKATTEALGPGLMLWSFQTQHAYPELEPGDLVAVETTDFVARDPVAGRVLKGRLWALGVVAGVGHPLEPAEISVWIRRFSDIVPQSEFVARIGEEGPRYYDIYDPRMVHAEETATHYAITCSRGGGVEQIFGAHRAFDGGWTDARSAEVRAMAAPLPEPLLLMVPKAGEGVTTIVWLQAVSFR
ncbi:hypothetical protein, partial [Longimicrobium sp.]|uniref:hypothetical protein n=1 Tax=Longimicrobium sp. TaxID=2029185 RepID=UPI002E333F24